MRRNSLTLFLRRLVGASLPLAGCSTGVARAGLGASTAASVHGDARSLIYARLENARSQPDDGARSKTAVAVGDWFAETARLEAASVDAFLRLAGELLAHGAPLALCNDALKAADDEMRHARVAGALARKYGAAPAAAAIDPVAARSLEEIAVENAVEGCVGDTYGAVVALWQSERASDPVVRAVMQRIACDELAHAGLAWRVAAWLDDRLPHAERARVARARRAAARALVGRLHADPPEELTVAAGLPRRAPARAMAEAASIALWT